MKHIYIIIIAILVLLGPAQAQVDIYRNSFTSPADTSSLRFSFTKAFKPDEPVSIVNSTTESHLSIRGSNGSGASRGYTGFITIKAPITLYPGTTYRISFRARTIAQDAQIRFQRGASVQIAGNTGGTNIAGVAPSNVISASVAGYTNFTTTLTVSSVQTEYFSFYVNSILNESNTNNEYLYIDEIAITRACTVIAEPTTNSVSRCGRGSETLRASGAPVGGGYKWYSASTGGTVLAETSNYTTPVLENTTTYYVSTVNGNGCESARVPVTVTVNPILFGLTEFVNENLEVGKPGTLKLNSELFGKGHAVSIMWQSVRNNETTILGITEAPAASPATFNLVSAPGADTYFRAIITPISSVCYDESSLNVTSQGIVALPVELVSFKAQANADGINLTWRTASEQDNKGFEVQVSTDGKTFKNIGFVESKVGTTSLVQNYSFRDAKAASGTNYYRLKQIDFDGTSEYSKTIAVNLTLASASAVYPTLATNDVTVRLTRTDEQVTILVADIAGKQLAAVQNPSDRQVVVPVQHLQSGIYFVTVITGVNKEVFRFVKR
ncbi:T9SS type A sorting domain-containing protein [uncultured Pontibacter sp.]|uniref:Ig-like domain-containing protein n=1 Tax=uncultured Pontibacter sp. TaxID=453356 RepID=UPI0026290205|nr:T9SS type A sorting domain-containing protein [uncultured Pontibacter sp.]